MDHSTFGSEGRKDKMNANLFFISFLILLSISCASATQIDIIYPNENITTDIYYSTGDNMFSIQNNTLNISNDVTYVLIKNQYESTDIIESPENITNYVILIFWVILLGSIILMLVVVARRILK